MLSEKNGRMAITMFPSMCFFQRFDILHQKKGLNKREHVKNKCLFFTKEERLTVDQADEMCLAINCSSCSACLSHVTSTVTP